MGHLSFTIFILSSSLAQGKPLSRLTAFGSVKLPDYFCPLLKKMPLMWFQTHL